LFGKRGFIASANGNERLWAIGGITTLSNGTQIRSNLISYFSLCISLYFFLENLICFFKL